MHSPVPDTTRPAKPIPQLPEGGQLRDTAEPISTTGCKPKK